MLDDLVPGCRYSPGWRDPGSHAAGREPFGVAGHFSTSYSRTYASNRVRAHAGRHGARRHRADERRLTGETRVLLPPPRRVRLLERARRVLRPHAQPDVWLLTRAHCESQRRHTRLVRAWSGPRLVRRAAGARRSSRVPVAALPAACRHSRDGLTGHLLASVRWQVGESKL